MKCYYIPIRVSKIHANLERQNVDEYVQQGERLFIPGESKKVTCLPLKTVKLIIVLHDLSIVPIIIYSNELKSHS